MRATLNENAGLCIVVLWNVARQVSGRLGEQDSKLPFRNKGSEVAISRVATRGAIKFAHNREGGGART